MISIANIKFVVSLLSSELELMIVDLSKLNYFRFLYSLVFIVIFVMMASCERNNDKYAAICVFRKIESDLVAAVTSEASGPLSENGMRFVKEDLVIQIMSKYPIKELYINRRNIDGGFIEVYAEKSLIARFQDSRYRSFCLGDPEGQISVDLKDYKTVAFKK